MSAIAYGVGVGPGDPELMTLKAIRLIKENDVIALPGKVAEETAAYKIAEAVVPEIKDKALVPINMPMVKDRNLLDEEHRKGAKIIEEYLDHGKNVVFLTLGDPAIYCTFSCLQRYLEADGYQVELISGITSICAAAARLNMPLTEWDEPLHVIPAAHKAHESLYDDGTNVLLKSASHMKEIKSLLRESGKKVWCVENCGMDAEKIYTDVDEIPNDAGYFSIIITKDKRQNH